MSDNSKNIDLDLLLSEVRCARLREWIADTAADLRIEPYELAIRLMKRASGIEALEERGEA